jgi:hypothetical protein
LFLRVLEAGARTDVNERACNLDFHSVGWKDKAMRDPDRPRLTGALVTSAATTEPWTSEICRLVNERYQLGAFQIQFEENA